MQADLSMMQNMMEECLEVERGTRKMETGKEEHLEHTDSIIAKQKQKVEEAANKTIKRNSLNTRTKFVKTEFWSLG